ncbi:MAG: 4Fe-4S dicluster domain-containing protein [Acidobacteriia bacterium]|nr:4Fe-4S dicluster domain-containing protein [Terriglobia bacterium]
MHPQHSNFTGPDQPTWDLYSKCIHCGLCLQQCPTYRVLGREADSPRGRIYQVLQVDAGRLEIGDSFVTHMDRCLGCRACETACPSGVQYGRILERARAEIESNYKRPWLERRLRDWFFTKVLHRRKGLERWAKWLRAYQRSGLQQVARASGMLKLLGLDKVEALAPQVDSVFFFPQLGMLHPAEGEWRGRVLFHVGCIASVAFSGLNEATVRVLNKNGFEVFIPRGQRCCGALQAHAGYREEAQRMARRNLRAFFEPNRDAIITNSAGCGAMMKEYGELLHDNPKYGEHGRDVASKVKDVTEFLAEVGLRPPQRPLKARVTYQDPCHLAHAQQVRSAPRELLKALGAELVEMAHPDYCCGSAGTYNVTQNELSMKILEQKMDEVTQTRAEIIATANTGCMLQLRAGVKTRGLHARVAHVIELLNEAYEDPLAPAEEQHSHHRRKRKREAPDS